MLHMATHRFDPTGGQIGRSGGATQAASVEVPDNVTSRAFCRTNLSASATPRLVSFRGAAKSPAEDAYWLQKVRNQVGVFATPQSEPYGDVALAATGAAAPLAGDAARQPFGRRADRTVVKRFCPDRAERRPRGASGSLDDADYCAILPKIVAARI